MLIMMTDIAAYDDEDDDVDDDVDDDAGDAEDGGDA